MAIAMFAKTGAGVLKGFYIFEICCGCYFPLISTLRANVIPERLRANYHQYIQTSHECYRSFTSDLKFLYIDSVRPVLPIVVYWILVGSCSAIDVWPSFQSLLSVAPLSCQKRQRQTYYNVAALCSETHSQLVHIQQHDYLLFNNKSELYENCCTFTYIMIVNKKLILHGESAHHNSETHDIVPGSS
ncbi:6900_t:CDS:2 [Paraglomus occultum]|uniref:6900_t:CDS:1 n=1 Tax=Paraglomus occultum TaxID=144539 RepID=A0A9N9CQD3_9GLOM|nr:6900_t:CDS:2 [Paraglomus occultum]